MQFLMILCGVSEHAIGLDRPYHCGEGFVNPIMTATETEGNKIAKLESSQPLCRPDISRSIKP